MCPIRIVLDRASSVLDPVLHQMDSVTNPVFRTGTHVHQKGVNSGTNLPSLTEVLNKIQNLRRFCFRPRPAQDQKDVDSRTTGSTSCQSADSNCGPGEFSSLVKQQNNVGNMV